MYYFRLDDASEYMDAEKWLRIENIFDRYDIHPLVGIIPQNKDQSLITAYQKDIAFWDKALKWKAKGWKIALHGYEHLYLSRDGGINPVNNRSEFAGISYDMQAEKIRNGYEDLISKNIKPEVFFAPSHTFDNNTLLALKNESEIRIISDTVANDVYYKDGFYYIPQQSGNVRKLPFKVVTFCYHPNMMLDNDFVKLESFIKVNRKKIANFEDILLKKRKLSLIDKLYNKLYFLKRMLREK